MNATALISAEHAERAAANRAVADPLPPTSRPAHWRAFGVARR
jgi:hypothetical protein